MGRSACSQYAKEHNKKITTITLHVITCSIHGVLARVHVFDIIYY